MAHGGPQRRHSSLRHVMDKTKAGRAVRRLTTLALMLAATTAALAIERRPLPAFALTDVAGQPVSSTSLPPDGKWLLVYVQPKCAACDTLLTSIDVREQPAIPARLIVIVGRTDAAGAAAMAAKFPDLTA